MKDNTIIIVVAEVFLGIFALFTPDPLSRGVAVGAMAGILGGHLNGSASSQPAPQASP